jgi:hypothetical protein
VSFVAGAFENVYISNNGNVVGNCGITGFPCKSLEHGILYKCNTDAQGGGKVCGVNE